MVHFVWMSFKGQKNNLFASELRKDSSICLIDSRMKKKVNLLLGARNWITIIISWREIPQISWNQDVSSYDVGKIMRGGFG